MLTDDDIINAITDAPMGSSVRGHLLAIGRAIEAKALAQLPKADLLAAAAYLEGDGVSMLGEEADRIAAVLRELAQ